MTQTQRPGRPKDPEKAKAIMHSAAQLFMSHGFGVSMDKIAQNAGVSKQTLYSHFPNKDALFENVIAGKMATFFDETQMPRSQTLTDELMDRGQRILDLMSDPEVIEMRVALIMSIKQHPHISELFNEAGPQTLCRHIASSFQRHDPDGRFAPYDQTAMAFVHALAGHLMFGALHTPNYQPQTPEGFLESMVARFSR